MAISLEVIAISISNMIVCSKGYVKECGQFLEARVAVAGEMSASWAVRLGSYRERHDDEIGGRHSQLARTDSGYSACSVFSSSPTPSWRMCELLKG